jgi:hypothetical protein
MSLINDALKKAQKQRTGEAPPLASMPSVGGESAHRIAKRAKPAGFNTLLTRAGMGAGVMLVLVVGGYFILRSPPAEKSAGAGLPPAPPGKNTPAVTDAPPISAQPTTPTTFVLPVAAKIEAPAPKVEPPAPIPPTPAVQPARQASAQIPEPKSQTPVASASAQKLEPRAIQYIENIKVAGIMARTADAKVLMNDRVYRVGSIVEAELGLKLVEITASSLTFEDERGGRYTRTF